MENYQKALNYETVCSVLKKADSYCTDLFLQISNECDVREELPYNVRRYAEIMGTDVQTVNEAYSACRTAFSRLDDKVVILDPSSPLWPSDVTGVPFLYLKGDDSLQRSKPQYGTQIDQRGRRRCAACHHTDGVWRC